MNPKNLSPNYIHFQDLKGIAGQSSAPRRSPEHSGSLKLLSVSSITLTAVICVACLIVYQQFTKDIDGQSVTAVELPDIINDIRTTRAVSRVQAAKLKSDPAIPAQQRSALDIHPEENPGSSNYVFMEQEDFTFSAKPDITELPETPIHIAPSIGSVSASVSEPALQLEQRPEPRWIAIKVDKGDSLSAIFNRHGLPNAEAVEIANASVNQSLHSLKIGHTVNIKLNSLGQFTELNYELDLLNMVYVDKMAGNEYSSRIDQIKSKIRIRDVSTPIYDSLFETAEELDIENGIIESLSDIFRWDIDFSRDIQGGDRFSVIYEQKFIDDELITNGDILAAEFIINGKVTRAIRYLYKNGHVEYYTPEGDSLRKAFIRNPVRSARISSKFSNGRFHPVLKKWRAHKGVDYAAPRGTPIMATADGVIRHIGRKGAYGKAIVIDHGQGYTTLYGHMKGYSKGLKNGARVQQGQTIGYVGSTGMSTGPHLHYEFQINGNHVDPLAVKLPKSLPIDSDEYGDFIANAEALVRRLDALQGQSIAVDAIAHTQPSG